MMKHTILTTVLTAIAATAAHADPGHIEAAGHGHSHWLGYGILAGITVVAAGMWLAKTTATRRHQ